MHGSFQEKNFVLRERRSSVDGRAYAKEMVFVPSLSIPLSVSVTEAGKSAPVR